MYVRGKGLNDDLARDVVQDVVMSAILKVQELGSYEAFLQPFESVADFARWCRTRCHWHLIDTFRYENRLIGFDAPHPLPFTAATQEDQTFAHELDGLIATLPKRQRTAIEGALLGCSVKELAEKMRVSEATVRSLQRFARVRLASMLEEERR